MFQKRLSKKIAEYQNELISKHCDEVENIYRQMRGWRHDFHNHIQAIKACIALGELDKLNEYCDRLEEDLKSVDKLVRTGNVMLDAILNSKLSLAKHKDIEVNIKANVPNSLLISDVDLCVLMGNLLDNAIEACSAHQAQRTPDFDHPFVRVYMGMKGHQLYICVTNTVCTEIKKTAGRFLSTKNSSSHGFGLMRIDKICAKYEGYCKRNYEPGAFSTEILLPVGTV